MKKKLLAIFAAFLCASLAFSGCEFGNFIENGSQNVKPPAVKPAPGEDDDPDNPNPPVIQSTHYTVTLYNGTTPYLPGDNDITVIWKNDFSAQRVLLGADGKADAGELEGAYSIYLEGLPSEFTYNPSQYKATDDDHEIAILLTTVRSPESGNGSGIYSCYKLKYDGTYRVSLSSASKVYYYEYQPQAAGVYSIVSWVNAYENEVNPYIQLYGGTIGMKWFERELDGGGFSIDGGYTKNFRYEYRIDRTEVGHSFTFAVGAETKSGAYPVSVDFAITYEGPYTSDVSDVRIIRAEEARRKADEKKATETFVYANYFSDSDAYFTQSPNKNFSTDYFRYNDNTGFYHVYDAVKYESNPYGFGRGYGPRLCCALDYPLASYEYKASSVPSVDENGEPYDDGTVSGGTLYEANVAGLGGGTNLLKLYNVWLEKEEKYVVMDYTMFVRDDYKKVCNSDGICYVTKELKEFLQIFAERHTLWTDNVSSVNGTPEYKGYTAKQDALWLFACGAYVEV